MTSRELPLAWEEQEWLSWGPISWFVQVSNFGRVLSKNVRGRPRGWGVWHELEQSINGSGYLVCSYGFVHRLVAEAWISNPFEFSDVNHRDGDKWNNSVENLEWVSHRDNIHHARDTLKIRFGPRATSIRLVETGEIFKSIGDCAREINGDKANIARVVNGQQPHYRGLHFERNSPHD